MRIALLSLFTVLLALAAPAPLRAERLVMSLSSRSVTINSSYSGADLVLFGTIDPDEGRTLQPDYDIVVTVIGPNGSFLTFRKEREFGIWLNADYRLFAQAPAYLGIFANRPIMAITDAEVARRQQLGLDRHPLLQRIGPDFADTTPQDPFRAAFVRLRKAQGLYLEHVDGVQFLTPRLFRTTIPLPAKVPTGHYTVDARLFAHGRPVAQVKTDFDISKVGFEQFVAEQARNNGLLYGLATVAMALLTGWIASVVFRRD